MNRLVVFNDAVEIGVSDIYDGTMRFFGEGDEQEIIDNQARLGELIGLPKEKVLRVRTIYDGRESYNDYFEVTEENLEEFCTQQSEKEIKVSDGLVTRLKNVGILLPLADCLGAVFYDEEQRIIGLLHAGRHNIEQNGPENFLRFLKEEFSCDAARLKVWLSPCARNYLITKLNNQKLLDAAKEQMLKMGVLEENIIDSCVDVVTSEIFPSCSAGDKTNRFAVVVKQN